MPQNREWRNRLKTLTLIDTGGHLTHLHRKLKLPRLCERLSFFSYYNRQVNTKYVWRAHEEGTQEKSRGWYVTIGVLAIGAAGASFIVGNILFGFLVLLGAFTLMLAGTRRDGVEHVYRLSDKGLHIDAQLIPWDRVQHFFIKDTEPPTLLVDTKTLLGITSIPLTGIDFRAVRTEFKNRNIDEQELATSVINDFCRTIGL